MTTTTNPAAATITDAFKYWDQVPRLAPFTDADDLRRTYEEQAGPTYYFHPDTLRFFGSRNFHLPAPGVSVECQTNAPEGVGRYRVTAWVLDPDNADRLTPQGLATCDTLAEARRLASEVAAAWPV